MEITNSSYISSSSALRGTNRTDKAAVETLQPTMQSSASVKDSVSFSEEALRLSGAGRLSDAGKTEAGQNGESAKIRFDLVNRIKAEINAGTYDTPEKMDAAIERMATRIRM